MYAGTTQRLCGQCRYQSNRVDGRRISDEGIRFGLRDRGVGFGVKVLRLRAVAKPQHASSLE